MIDSFSDLFALIGGGTGLGGGGFALWQAKQNKSDIKDMEDDIKSQRDRLADHILYSANTYSKHDDFKELSGKLDRVIEQLGLINVTLAQKADKE